jgi:PAS domain S-box-containing protein
MKKDGFTEGHTTSSRETARSLRAEAETKIKAVELDEVKSLSADELSGMFHELRVHQVELQMQNEELRIAQQELEASRQRYVDLYEFAPVGYCTLSREGLVLESNLTLATMLAIDGSSLTRRMLSDFVAPEDLDRYYYHRRLLFEAGEPQRFEIRMKRNDSEFFWAFLDSALPRGMEPKVGCRVVITDITARKGAEEELTAYREGLEELVRVRTSALEEANARLEAEVTTRTRAEKALEKARDGLEDRVRERTAELRKSEKLALRQKTEIDVYYDSSPIGLCVLDRDLRYLRINRRLADLNGRPPEAHIGRTVREVLPPPLADQVEPLFRRVIETGAPIRDIEYVEDTPQQAGFRNTWLETFNPLFDRSGKVIGVTVAVQDITELRKLEGQLSQAQKMEALGALAGGIAHDFNNILAAMIGFTELVRDRLPEGSLEGRHTAKILAAGARGRDLVRQILTFSRQTSLKKQSLNLSNIVRESVKFLRASTPSTITLTTHVGSDSGRVLGDPVQIQRVLMNLVTNAVYALRDTGGTITITLSRAEISSPAGNPGDIEPGRYVRLTVRDTGAGIPAHIVDRIFDPFFTTKQVGEGTGLGLSVVLGIVKQSNGYVTVESEPGKGAAFDVYFPVIDSDEKPALAEGTVVPTGTERILLVDDEEALAETGKKLLDELGYAVTSRTGSRAALALFRLDPGQFDLVITDQTMPEMTGTQLAHELLAIKPDIPVILCTGFSEAVTEEVAKAARIRAFVMKPFTKLEIARIIRRVLAEQGPLPTG